MARAIRRSISDQDAATEKAKELLALLGPDVSAIYPDADRKHGLMSMAIQTVLNAEDELTFADGITGLACAVAAVLATAPEPAMASFHFSMVLAHAMGAVAQLEEDTPTGHA